MTDEPHPDPVAQKLIDTVHAARQLAAKAKHLVEMLDDAEVNHGGLWAGKTMRARDELRLELSKW